MTDPSDHDGAIWVITMSGMRNPGYHLRQLCRKLKVGGVLVAKIDLRDHRHFTEPFTFLTYDDETWKRHMRRGPQWEANMWRAPDYRNAFERMHMPVLEWKTNRDAMPPHRPRVYVDVEMTDALRATFAPRFRAMSLGDLSVQFLGIIARKGPATDCRE